jgi:hypothetical protein
VYVVHHEQAPQATTKSRDVDRFQGVVVKLVLSLAMVALWVRLPAHPTYGPNTSK